MSKKLIFNKKSVIIERYDYSTKENITEKLHKDYKGFNALWNYNVEFAKGLTIEEFLQHLRPFTSDIQNVLSPYINCEIKDFFEMLDINPTNSLTLKDNDINHIEMFWNCEVWEVKDENGEKISDFELWGGYHGIPKNPNELNISFGLLPISEWKHYEFKLNENIICYKNTNELKQEILFESTYGWNLFDLLKNFFIELTFYGSLSDIEELKKVIEGTIMDLDNTESLEILNELEIEELEKEMQNLVQQEKYEEAAIIRNRIKELSPKK